MADALNDCPSPSAGAAGTRPMDTLPTLQRNALCKIFDRREFLPEEVAGLGYRRLQQAEGIGRKGLAEIGGWLRAYGFALIPPDPGSQLRPPPSKKTRMNIESAVRLLRTHGYLVQQAVEAPGGPDDGARRMPGGAPGRNGWRKEP